MRAEFLSYFESELVGLYERAELIARNYPERGLGLGTSRLADADISMRLLLEGVAYLSARVRDRVERSDYRLSMRLVSIMFPGMLDAIPPKLLARLDAKGSLSLGDAPDAAQDCVALPEGDGRRRFALKPEWKVQVEPVNRIAFEMRWRGRGCGVELEIRIELDGDDQSREFSEIVLAGVESPGSRVTDLSRRFAAALLCSGEVTLEVSGRQLPLRCEPALWARTPNRSDARCDLRDLMEALAWIESSSVVRLSLRDRVLIDAAETLVIRASFAMADETLVADVRRLSIIANVAGMSNRQVVQSDRFEADLRRMHNFFSPRNLGIDQLVIRAVGARAFEPRSNKRVAVSFVSSCGPRRLDRGADWIVVHEPAWAQEDEAAVDSRFSESVCLLRPTSRTVAEDTRLDISIDIEVCNPIARTAIRPGCPIQVLSGSQVAEGGVIGTLEGEIATPAVRDSLGGLLRLGLGSFATIVAAKQGDLGGFCEDLLTLLAPPALVNRLGWSKGTLGVVATPNVFIDSVEGVSTTIRGWTMVVSQTDAYLRSGAGPLLSALVFKFLKSRCPVNTRLQMQVCDPDGSVWMKFDG